MNKPLLTNSKNSALLGIAMTAASLSAFWSEGYAEKSYEASIAPQIEKFIEDAPTIESSLIQKQQELIQDRITLESTIGKQCMAYLFAPTVRTTGSGSPCSANSRDIANYEAQLSKQNANEKQNLKNLSIVRVNGENMLHAQLFLHDRRQSSTLKDALDGPFFKSKAIHTLQIDQKSGVVRSSESIEVPTTIHARSVFAGLLASAGIGLLAHATQQSIRHKRLIYKFKKQLKSTELTVEAIKHVPSSEDL